MIHNRETRVTTFKKVARIGVDSLLSFNKEWSEAVQKEDPEYFTQLSKVNNPQYLWIGCSDSRVPANQVVGLAPGEIYVHRNIANVVSHSDMNCQSVLHGAVEVLNVEHIIVCGHYGCGGVTAAYKQLRLGLVDNWISQVVDVHNRYRDVMELIPSQKHVAALCELNVIAQCINVCDTHLIQDWWNNVPRAAADCPPLATAPKSEKHSISVHGWIYGLEDGLITPLITVKQGDDIQKKRSLAVAEVIARHSR